MGDPGGEGRSALRVALQDPVTARPPRHGRWRRLEGLLWPPSDPRMSRLEALAVLLVAFVVCLLRLPPEVAFDTVWAEDATVFLAQAEAGSFSDTVLGNYAGYAHVGPRIAASLVGLLPLGYAAMGLAAAAAAVQATAALVGYVVVRAHRRARGPALLVAAAVALVPVGPEVVLNIANMQWFLLYGGVAAQLWAPRTVAGRGLQLGVGLLLALSCPFGFLAAGVALVRAVVTRTGWAVGNAAALVVAVGVQLTVIATANADRVTREADRGALVAGFVRRVIADGLLGIGSLPVGKREPSVTAGFVLLVAFAVLLAVAVARDGALRQAPVVALLLLSYLAYAVPVVLTGLPALDLVLGGRYFVAPALLWVTAFALVLPTSQTDRRGVLLGGVAFTAFGVVLASGWYSSWAAPQQLRAAAPRWSASVELARGVCRQAGPATSVALAVAPPGSRADLPCPAVRGGGGG